MLAFVAQVWFVWLIVLAVSFLVLELGFIALAHYQGQKNISEWTLSDTIRRWSAARRWLAPLTIGSAAALMWHFFGQTNL